MKLADWLQPDDIAIGYVAMYCGIPKYGHTTCYTRLEPTQHPLRHITRESLGEYIAVKLCIECGELLVPIGQRESGAS